MFFNKNKNSQPAATVHQSTFGVSEMSDDDLIAVTGGAANSNGPAEKIHQVAAYRARSLE